MNLKRSSTHEYRTMVSIRVSKTFDVGSSPTTRANSSVAIEAE